MCVLLFVSYNEDFSFFLGHQVLTSSQACLGVQAELLGRVSQGSGVREGSGWFGLDYTCKHPHKGGKTRFFNVLVRKCGKKVVIGNI